MNHFYEDILRVVGECGPWQVRRLVLLWLLMLMCGAHYTIIDYIELNTEEFVCSYGDCQAGVTCMYCYFVLFLLVLIFFPTAQKKILP